MITLEHISKVYEGANRVEALKDISLTIEKGQIYGIIGQSGAGKSTLIRCINMLEAPTSGSVIVDGTDLTKLSASELRKARKHIGMIFQHFNLLWSRTVISNIMFPLEIAGVSRAEAKQRALELVELVGLKGREKAYPSELSGGQKQRVGIARALANDPAIIMADEPTGNLDSKSTIDVMNIFRGLYDEGRTIILVTHEPEIATYASRNVVLRDGLIVEDSQNLNMTPVQEVPHV